MNTSSLFIPVSCSILGLLPASAAIAQRTEGAAATPVEVNAAAASPPAAGVAETPVGEPQQAQPSIASSVAATPEGAGLASPLPTHAPRECVPSCRAGYFCREGTCLSLCNPPCAAGEQCNESGACIASAPPQPPPSPTRPPSSTTEAPPLAPGTADPSADTSLLLKRWAIGGALGVSLPGTIYVGSSGEFDTETSYVLDLFADAIVAPLFSIGAFITHAPLVVEDADGDAKLWSFGVTLKGRFALSTRVALRPGVVMGYNSVTIDDSDLDAFQGLNVGAHLDLAIALSRSGGLVPRLGFFSQPVGGNGDIGMDFPPIFYIAVGYEFGS